jgi:hypothetical protein
MIFFCDSNRRSALALRPPATFWSTLRVAWEMPGPRRVPSRVGWRFLNHWTGGVAPAFAPLRRGESLDPRLLSGKPSACADGVTKPNFRCRGRADAIVSGFLRQCSYREDSVWRSRETLFGHIEAESVSALPRHRYGSGVESAKFAFGEFFVASLCRHLCRIRPFLHKKKEARKVTAKIYNKAFGTSPIYAPPAPDTTPSRSRCLWA